MKLMKSTLLLLFIVTPCLPVFPATAKPRQEGSEPTIKVKSKDLQGLSAEVKALLSGKANYTATQKTDYRIDLTLAINKHVSRDPYKCAVLLIQLTQYSGAADGESISPSLNEIFLKYPVPAIRAILDASKYLLKEFNNEEYINSLFTQVIQFPFYYLEDKKTDNESELIQKEKNRLIKEITRSNLDAPIKNIVVNHIKQMHL